MDLAHPHVASGRRRDRLEARVLCEEERVWMERGAADSASRVRRFWALWAAKETGYKVLCKTLGRTPVLEHRTFISRIELVPAPDGLVEVRGEVRKDALRVHLTGWASPEFIHLVGTDRPEHASGSPRLEIGTERIPEGLSLDDLRDEFTDREWPGVHSVAAARARILVRRRLVSHLDPSAPLPEILTSGRRPGRTPPVAEVEGVPVTGVDLSLSHHGRYVAWALLLPSPEQDPGPDPDPGSDGGRGR